MSRQNSLDQKRLRAHQRAAKKDRARRRIRFAGVVAHGAKVDAHLPAPSFCATLSLIAAAAMRSLSRKRSAKTATSKRKLSSNQLAAKLRPIKGVSVPRRAA